MLQEMNEFRRGQIEAMEFPPEISVVVSLRTNWEGAFWVRRRGEEGTEGYCPGAPFPAWGR